MKIISAETFRQFMQVVDERDLDRSKCVFAPLYDNGERYLALVGRRVRSKDDLIGLFSQEEVAKLVA